VSDPQASLKNFPREHDFLIAVDSDGTVFDTVELKQKECFIPNLIRFWNLQAVSRYAREVAEFVNLSSKWRGTNRWPALIRVFDLLRERPQVRRRGASIPVAQPLRDWIRRETTLSNTTLKAEIERNPDPVLHQGLEWSEAVDDTIRAMVRGVPPFPLVRESLRKISEWADVIVCSTTPCAALEREWQEHDIARYVKVIAGQEMGGKKEQIKLASDGRYEKDKVLMIGDAPGDREAAKANGAGFFPINPGAEEASWEKFFEKGTGAFRDGSYAAEYESGLIAAFDALLSEVPPWKR